ncbi:MAG: Hsp20/alpha crystallin family protein [Cyanobacteria bacterium P01_C01_bin.89]
MAINDNNANFSGDQFNGFNNNSDDNNAANNANGVDNWTQAFNQEVAQRQASAMMEQVMAMAGKIQEQMQQQMQQMQEEGVAQGFGSPGAASVPQGDVLRDSETAIIVSLTLPGLQEESVKVDVKDQLLKITGQVDAAALVPPGFPAPPTLGFTRMLALPVAVQGDRPTITTTDSTLSIILPKVEPGHLTEDQLRQMAKPPMTANPMAGVFEVMMREMSAQAGRRNAPVNPFANGNFRDRVARWQKAATANINRWGKAAQAQAEQVLDKIKSDDRTAAFDRQAQRHGELVDQWGHKLTQGRQWLGQQLKELGDRLSK